MTTSKPKASKHHEKSCQTESRGSLSTFLLFVFSVEKEQLKPEHLIHKYNFEGKKLSPWMRGPESTSAYHIR